MDAKMNPPSMTSDMEDFSWNAVWESGAIITDSGWSFEMFIPFSAIRFGKKRCKTGASTLPAEDVKRNNKIPGTRSIRT